MLKPMIILLLLTVFTSAQISSDWQNRLLLAQNYEQAGEYEKAKSILEDLIKIQPDNYQIFQTLNRVYFQLKKYDESINLISKRIETSPQDINLYGLLGSSYYLKGDEKRAFEIWDSALSIQPVTPMNYRIIANAVIERRAFEKAIEILKKGKTFTDQPQIFSYDLANIYALTMQYREAAEEYCDILMSDPNQLKFVESRMLTYVTRPDALEQAISVIERRRDKKNINYAKLLAALHVENKAYEKAFQLYREIDAQAGSQGAELFNLGQKIYNLKEYKTAALVFNEIVSTYPASPFVSIAKLGYAKTMEAALLEELDQVTPNWKPYYLFKPNESVRVETIINAYMELVRIYPRSEVAYESFLRAGKLELYQQHDLDEAEKYFMIIVEESPLSQFAPEANEELGNIYLIKGELDQAKKYFLNVLTNPRILPAKKNGANYNLAKLEFYKKNIPAAKGHLSKIILDLKDNFANDAIEFQLLLNTSMNDSLNILLFSEAEFLSEQKKFSEAASRYQMVSSKQSGLMLQNLAQLREAEMFLAEDDFSNTLSLLSNIADQKEKNIYSDKALYLSGKIYEFGLKDTPKALEIYEKLLAEFPNSLFLDEAREQIIKLRNKQS